MSTDTIEQERSAIVAKMVEQLSAEIGAKNLDHEVVGARLDAAFPQFDYSASLDDYTKHVVVSAPPAVADESLHVEHARLEAKGHGLRAELQKQTTALTLARTALGRGIAALNSQVPRLTPDQAAQEFCRGQQAERAAGGPRNVPVPQHRSALDRQAFWQGAQSGTHDANDHLRRNHLKNGGLRGQGYARSKLAQS